MGALRRVTGASERCFHRRTFAKVHLQHLHPLAETAVNLKIPFIILCLENPPLFLQILHPPSIHPSALRPVIRNPARSQIPQHKDAAPRTSRSHSHKCFWSKVDQTQDTGRKPKVLRRLQVLNAEPRCRVPSAHWQATHPPSTSHRPWSEEGPRHGRVVTSANPALYRPSRRPPRPASGNPLLLQPPISNISNNLIFNTNLALTPFPPALPQQKTFCKDRPVPTRSRPHHAPARGV